MKVKVKNLEKVKLSLIEPGVRAGVGDYVAVAWIKARRIKARLSFEYGVDEDAKRVGVDTNTNMLGKNYDILDDTAHRKGLVLTQEQIFEFMRQAEAQIEEVMDKKYGLKLLNINPSKMHDRMIVAAALQNGPRGKEVVKDLPKLEHTARLWTNQHLETVRKQMQQNKKQPGKSKASFEFAI